MKKIRVLIVLLLSLQLFARAEETLEETARAKMAELEELMAAAEDAGFDTLKEAMSLNTADIYLRAASWDEENVSVNSNSFAQVFAYKNDPLTYAQDLPDFERDEVILLLDEAIDRLTKLQAGELFRDVAPDLDWSKITHDGDQLTFDGRPIFPSDYSWKPDQAELTNFYGRLDGYFVTPSYVINEAGDIKASVLNALESKPSGQLGFIFVNNKNPPDWAEEKYGPDFRMREGTYTEYDIDNPGAREIMHHLFSAVGPYFAGQNYSNLGYMLCNEPHFITSKSKDSMDSDDWGWASGTVSEYTKAKFRTWLSTKHDSIDDLNTLWGSSFADFDAVDLDIPIWIGLKGTPMWYDWIRFNQLRVTEWYTWLKGEIQANDPAAKVHLKLIPGMWAEYNNRAHGLDHEALTELSAIIGNDSGAEYTHMWKTREWQENYAFDWREMCMGYDFFKSISPDKIAFNSEVHYLTATGSVDLYQDPAYARATFWLAHTLGMNAGQIWNWLRNADGSLTSKATGGFAGSCCQQPRIVNEVAATMMDLNTWSEEITAMQRQRKPIRLFHSETSVINKETHMDEEFELYESLCFEGLPLGFVTENILNKQDHSQWDVVLIRETQYVTTAERAAVQTYLDNGGTVIMDEVSLTLDEYGRAHEAVEASNGTLISVGSIAEMKAEAMAIMSANDRLPEVAIEEVNTVGSPGCFWKCIENYRGNPVLSIVNLGKTDATLTIDLDGASAGTKCMDLITGTRVSSTPVLEPYEVLFVEVMPDVLSDDSATLDPVADAFVQGGSYSNENFNTTLLFCKTDTANEKWTRQAFLRFDLSSISAGSIVSGLLRLKVESNDNAGLQHSVYSVTDDSWQEDSLTWTAKPVLGTRLDAAVVPAAGEWIELDVSDQIYTERAGDKELSLVLVSEGTGVVKYHSSEAATEADRPQLAISTEASEWEIFVSDNGLSGDLTADFDGDGLLDIQEFAQGGDPCDTSDQGMTPRLVIDSNKMVSVYNLASSAANAGVSYVTQWNTNLVGGTWNSDWDTETNLVSGVSGYQKMRRQIQSAGKDQLFFRVKVQSEEE